MTRNGFTLLEMLVALVVFGLVMAGIGQTFKFGLTAWRQGPAKTTEPENLAALDMALTRMISQTLPGTMTGTLAGQASQIAFTTTLPPGAQLQAAGPAPLADAAILLQNSTLILRYRPHPAGIPLNPPPTPQTETLAENIITFKAEYLSKKPGKNPEWTEKWKANTLPILVRLQIKSKNKPNWPDIILQTNAAAK